MTCKYLSMCTLVVTKIGACAILGRIYKHNKKLNDFDGKLTILIRLLKINYD